MTSDGGEVGVTPTESQDCLECGKAASGKAYVAEKKKKKKPQNKLLKEDIERIVEVLNYSFWPDIQQTY